MAPKTERTTADTTSDGFNKKRRALLTRIAAGTFAAPIIAMKMTTKAAAGT